MGIGNLVKKGRLKMPEEPPAPKKERRDLWVAPRIMTALVSTREVDVKPDMWLSPSVLSGWCPKAWTMAYRMGVPLMDEIGPDNRWWMDGGTALHTMFQESWMGPSGILKGGWRCPACLHTIGIDLDDTAVVNSHGVESIAKVTVRSAQKCPSSCPSCGHTPTWRTPFAYIEPLVYDLDMRVCGLTDGIIDWGDQDDELWDLKTKTSTDSMEWIREAPDRDHVRQLNWYMDMAGVKYGRIVYMDRSAKHLAGAFVEHQVDYDPLLMAKEKEKVSAFREATKNPESSLPACPDGGQTRFGPCQCRELSRAWKDYRSRS